MFGPEDDLILKILPEIVEVIAVAGYPHNQVPVQFRMFLCFTECFGIDHIELDMMTIEAEVAPDKRCEAIVTLFILKERRGKFLVEQSASGTQVVDL